MPGLTRSSLDHFLEDAGICSVGAGKLLGDSVHSILVILGFLLLLFDLCGQGDSDLLSFHSKFLFHSMYSIELGRHLNDLFALFFILAGDILIIPSQGRNLLMNRLQFKLLHIDCLALELDHLSVCASQLFKVD